MRRIEKPEPDEYPPDAARYISLLPDDGFILQHLRENLRATTAFILSLPEERLAFRYAPGKWTIKEILGHVSDDERIYAYRALRFARGDPTELPGFEQDAFAFHSNANSRGIEDILSEFATVRAATVSLFEGLDDREVARAALARGLETRPMSLFYAGEPGRPGLELNYAAFDEALIRKGAAELASVVRSCLNARRGRRRAS